MDLSLKKKKGGGKVKRWERKREKGEWGKEENKTVAQFFLSGRVEAGYPKFHCPTNGSQKVLLPPQNSAGYQGAKSHCYLY